MNDDISVRHVQRTDYAAWRSMWDGYNAFYGRKDNNALPEDITNTTWERFFDSDEPIHALVAEYQHQIAGLTHYLFHRSTNRLHDVCYLQDLFTVQSLRGKGIARKLINAVYAAARQANCSRVYWQTQASNTTARALYDQVAEHKGFIVYAHELAK